MAYLTQTDLENRLGVPRVLALYDDDNTGTINQAAMDAVVQTASDLVDGTIARSYTGTFPMASPPPALAKEAAVLYAMALSFERKPEFALRLEDSYLTRLRTQADKLCERIATGLAKLVDAPPPVASSVVTGGVVQTSTTMFTVVDGSSSFGDF